MKTKRTIYFILIVCGAMMAGFGNRFMSKEVALSIGMVVLLFGIYKSTYAWTATTMEDKENEEEL